MAQISFRVDDNVKESAEKVLDELGLTMSSALTIFLKTVSREKRIPFELKLDPFYDENNIRYLEEKMKEYKEGRLQIEEHDLIEDDEECE